MIESVTSFYAPMDYDLACFACGYNLRTRRRTELCPECGSKVAGSVAIAYQKMRGDLRRVNRGAWLLAGTLPVLWLMDFSASSMFDVERVGWSNVIPFMVQVIASTMMLMAMAMLLLGRPARMRWAEPMSIAAIAAAALH